MQQFVAYYRLSRDSRSGENLGLDAQKKAVDAFLASRQAIAVAEFSEVVSGTGKRRRPVFEQALELCKQTKATLVCSNVSRISRDAFTILGLYKAGIDFVVADNPNLNKLTIGILALVAEEEARLISERTKVALAQARAKGTQLGVQGKRNAEIADRFANGLRPTIEPLRQAGASILAIQKHLNESGVRPFRGKAWSYDSTWNLCRRVENLSK